MRIQLIILCLLAGLINTALGITKPLSPIEHSELQLLGCKTIGYHFQNGYLIIGDQNTKKANAIFLIKNISVNSVIIDYPAAHLGASAGLTQCLKATQWAGYHFIKNKDLLRTTQGKQKPQWQCNAQNAKNYRWLDDKHKSYCDSLLYVCMITRSNSQGNPLQQGAAKLLLEKPSYSWFTASPTDSDCYAVNTLPNVLIDDSVK